MVSKLNFLLISGLLFLFACKSPEKKDKPNILWIVTEDISPALGCYGDTYAKTPNLDNLASSGLQFNHAYATAPICAPARSCLISGLYATSLGTQHLRTQVKKPEFIRAFPEYLREAGYFTSNYGKTDYNFTPEGIWEYWEQDLTPWRKRGKDQPFFSFLNIGSTHEGPGNRQERYEQAVSDLPDSLFHDPEEAVLPPYFPDTPEMRRIWAQYYDLISDMDIQVGQVLSELEKDGLMDETIIFFFSDHGFGLPRYKRWLYKTGLNVPLIVHVPDKYSHLLRQDSLNVSDELVSFVDFAPTVLNLAGLEKPDHMQGKIFLGKNPGQPREFVYGARSRADDMYEVSRAILNRDYIYIRNYLPHLPYIQPGFIFSDVKSSFRELRKEYIADELAEEPLKLWNPKPYEELYDLRNDPYELNNLADNTNYREIKEHMHKELNDWIIRTRDIGFLFEPEYWIRSADLSPFEMAADPEMYPIKEILEAAELVGPGSFEEINTSLDDDDPGVRFWAATALRNDPGNARRTSDKLHELLSDPSPVVQIAAAEVLCTIDQCEKALPVLEKWVQDDLPPLALYAARTLQLIGDKACPAVPVMKDVLNKNIRDPDAERAGEYYQDFNFSAFTAWALEVALFNCGEDIAVNAGR